MKVVLIVLDGVGCGEAPDAASYGDTGAHTLRHVAEAANPLLPNFCMLGLGHIAGSGFAPSDRLIGAYGRLCEQSPGKDTTTGHWEIAGLRLNRPFPTFPNGFPADLMLAFEDAIGRKTLGNCVASGTEIVDRLGEEHMCTGKPIVYTSADSVFQIAAHEEVIAPNELWSICETARKLLEGPNTVGRVIARPFIGAPGAFTRTGNRRDFSVPPSGDTLLDLLSRNGLDVVGIGKIEDIFAHRGLTATNHASGNPACIDATLAALDTPVNGLVFVNLVDFDMLYGHRRDPNGFARALEAVDMAIPALMGKMKQGDLLLFTADHGCDPSHHGTDHTREYAPLLAWMKGLRPVNLGDRASFGDIAATILELFGLSERLCGTSFADALRQ